jgi:hypothetical protein
MASPALPDSVDRMPVIGDRTGEMLKRLKELEYRVSKMEKMDKKETGAERPQGTADPGDVFVNAYMKCQRALKAAQEKDLDTAVTLFKEADELLAGLQEKDPNWQPGIVKYRRDRVAKELADLQKENKLGEKPEAKSGEERKP